MESQSYGQVDLREPATLGPAVGDDEPTWPGRALPGPTDGAPLPGAAGSQVVPTVGRRTRRVDVGRVLTWTLLGLGAVLLGFVAYAAFASALPESRAQVGLSRRFEHELFNSQAAIGGPIPRGTPVARLDITALGLHQVVVEGSSADQLRHGPGHLPVSPLPGQIGNSVILAHRLVLGGPFGSIQDLRPGDRISTLTGQGSATYRVTKVRKVPGSDLSIYGASRSNLLTLVTSAAWIGGERWVATASLVGSAEPAPDGRPAVLQTADLGLRAGGGAGPALALWVEVLALVGAASWIAYRRLPRWSSYLITTPILLSALWLVYGTVARFLPATL